jgi:putative N6-adenine-specific DNA methylase
VDPSSRFSFFAVTPPGLEDITRDELFSLGLNHPRPVPGGVEFAGFLTHLYRVNLWSRTASRVLVRLGEFEAKSFPELRRKAADLPWEMLLRPGALVSVRATCHKSKLYHSDAVAERVASAIGDRLGEPAEAPTPVRSQGGQDQVWAPSTEEPAPDARASPAGVAVVVRLDHDQCTISLDSSGAHLHQRGYRLAAARAPLRETLAAVLLLRAGYDPGRPLLDPLCGSGTFAIEAALIARDVAPGLSRPFAFMDWANFDEAEWNVQLAGARDRVRVTAPAPIHASDRDEGAVNAAAANAGRAGVASDILLRRAAISSILPPPGPGLVISNLPYGKRIGEDVRDLYAQFGNVMRAKCAGWRVGMLAGSLALARETRLPLEEPLIVENGGLKVPFVMAAA